MTNQDTNGCISFDTVNLLELVSALTYFLSKFINSFIHTFILNILNIHTMNVLLNIQQNQISLPKC